MTGVRPDGLGNLPTEPNSFIGRERDMRELALLLGGVRLLTLCGPGGIGKTRLALRLARDVQQRYPDGAWLVQLADITRPAQVARRVASVLRIREEPGRPAAEGLCATLHGRRLLLILDTCDRLADPCASLAQHLLARCPLLSMIATSREPLRVPGETVWRVPPLELPPWNVPAPQVPASRVQQPGGPVLQTLPDEPPAGSPRAGTPTEAVRLFAERAAAARTGFALTDENAEAVARLCRMLDGVPLAIELAAARVRALSVEQIADRLGDQFQLLASSDRTAPPRQQTLRAAVDWSYELLTPPEQVLLRRLSVFSGWTLEMAEEVCAAGTLPSRDIPRLLASLVDKSLVIADHDIAGSARYRMLDTIRQYAAGLLDAAGERAAVRERHRDCMVRLVESILARVFVRGDPPWPERVALYLGVLTERANLAAALSYSLERGEITQGLRLCTALSHIWLARGNPASGIRWFDRFLAVPGEVIPAVRGPALVQRGELAFEQQDYARAEECAREGLAICRSVHSPSQATAVRLLAQVRMRSGDSEAALRLAEEAIAAARDTGNDWEEGLALAAKGAILARRGAAREAQRSYQAALEVLTGNNGWGVAQTRYGLGRLAQARGDGQGAMEQFRAALAIFREIGARPEMARCLAGIGRVALGQADLSLSRESLAESLRLSLDCGPQLPVARCLEAFSALAAAFGDLRRSVRLAGAALETRAVAGHLEQPDADQRLGRLLEPARRRLSPATVEELLTSGRTMTADEAAAEALAAGPVATGTDGEHATAQASPSAARPGPPRGDTAPGGPAARTDPRSPSALTPREWEIAALVERGLTNRAIAGELVISQATVARHIANILVKLGFSSRAQIAAWSAAQLPAGPAPLR